MTYLAFGKELIEELMTPHWELVLCDYHHDMLGLCYTESVVILELEDVETEEEMFKQVQLLEQCVNDYGLPLDITFKMNTYLYEDED